MKYFQQIKQTKGFMSIEAVMGATLILMIVLAGVWFTTYLYPRILLSQEVHSLAQIAKVQGGSTDETTEGENSDVERFKVMLGERGYNAEQIIIECRTETNQSCLGAGPRLETGGHYISRDSKDYMYLVVSIPTKISFFEGVFGFFNVENTLPRNYVFKEVVLSERW